MKGIVKLTATEWRDVLSAGVDGVLAPALISVLPFTAAVIIQKITDARSRACPWAREQSWKLGDDAEPFGCCSFLSSNRLSHWSLWIQSMHRLNQSGRPVRSPQIPSHCSVAVLNSSWLSDMIFPGSLCESVTVDLDVSAPLSIICKDMWGGAGLQYQHDLLCGGLQSISLVSRRVRRGRWCQVVLHHRPWLQGFTRTQQLQLCFQLYSSHLSFNILQHELP